MSESFDVDGLSMDEAKIKIKEKMMKRIDLDV
jgi:hypothetical protein